MAKRALGKGLSALIDSANSVGEARYEVLPVDSISPNRLQPRKRFSDEGLQELADSLREHGVIQPVIVRPRGTGYELVAGERRWRAAAAAGLTSIPAIIRESEDNRALETALIENLHREDLNCIEAANAYRQLLEEFSMTHEEISKRLGKSRTTITNTMRLLQLPVEIQATVMAGEMSEGHARALLGLGESPNQHQLAERIIEETLSVRETEEAVRRILAGEARKEQGPKEPPRHLEDVERLLAASLKAKVTVIAGKRRGRMVIEFSGEEELERILSSILPVALREARKQPAG
ncbi:MAG: ParB/RepB/Spo0J family partition protein [Candidatus Geothermincolia bacterium]